jgi:predicted nucleic acid-binding protein
MSVLELELDKWETSAIALAIEKENSLLIIDEKKGRKIAKQMNLKITGILGVMVKAKEIGLIEKVKPILDKLEKIEFRISSKLKEEILKRADES